MQPSPEQIRVLSDYFSAYTDEQIQPYIDDAYSDVVDVYGITDPVKAARLTRYYTAHLLFIGIEQVKMTKEGDTSVTFKDNNLGDGLSSTPFGQEFLRLFGLFSQTKLSLLVI